MRKRSCHGPRPGSYAAAHGFPTEGSTDTIFTIGHSTRPLADFAALLAEHGIAVLVDVRTVPRSRHNPQFNPESLAPALGARGIEYRHEPALGGLRKPRKDSVNRGWRNDSFRGYADYMQTPAFAEAVEALAGLARARPTAIMCAEAVPWRCHRSMIADALLARGLRVRDVLGPGKTADHALTPFARVEGTRITYPGEQSELDL